MIIYLVSASLKPVILSTMEDWSDVAGVFFNIYCWLNAKKTNKCIIASNNFHVPQQQSQDVRYYN